MESHRSNNYSSGETLTLPARVLVSVVRGYQLTRFGRISPCRFVPSCSAYAIEALSRHGAAKGTVLAARRVLKCRPFGPHGFDPVPG
ncbi:MAG: membrane protein insertion efficiency factor YidD [Actinobacteria bacterium]|nr:membrane protein insertion efficiency factor YidD [Actinomycetota bacterium]